EPELVETFLRAYIEGTAYYKAHRDFGVGIHEKYTSANREVAEGTYDVTSQGFRDCPDPATPGLQLLIDFWKRTGVIGESFDLDDVTDSRPVLKACGTAR
ncbi:MAG: hypothetical protein WD533_06005, partial [Dehalococcoidia bacterium]